MLALVLGVLALEGFALAVADARAVGVRGDDWTGFAPRAGGACADRARPCAAMAIAEARRPPAPAAGLIAAAAVLGVYWVLVPVGIALMATHRPREAAETVDLGRASQPVTLRTADGLDLHGRYVTSRNGAAVIVFPGTASRAAQARALVRHGYGVLMLDMRGYADSDGDPNMFGWSGTKDVDAGVAFLARRADVRDGRIGGLGFSVGGEVMMEAAAGNPGLRAVVADGAGERSVRESRLRGRAGWLSLPSYLVQTAAVAVLSGDRPPPSLVDVALEDCAASALPDRRGRGQRRRGPPAALLRGSEGAEGVLEDPRGRAHGRLRRSSPRVRAPADRLLRRCPARAARALGSSPRAR